MDSTATRLDAAVHELYGVPPEEFVDARKRLSDAARADGDRALSQRITALRRPTVSAWAVNRLARDAGDDLRTLLELGTALRAAWASGKGLGRLGEIEERRTELIDHLVRCARDLAGAAGRPLREPAVREVEDTLRAATVDEEVAAEVGAGRLDRPRSHSGFVPMAPPAEAPADGGGRRVDPVQAVSPGRVSPGRPRIRLVPPVPDEPGAAKAAPRPQPVPRSWKGDHGPAAPGDAPRLGDAPHRGSPAARPEPAGRAGGTGRRGKGLAAAPAPPGQDLAEAEAVLAEWRERQQTTDQELDAIDQETRRLRAELHALAERRKAAERRATVARRERINAARRVESARRRAGEDP